MNMNRDEKTLVMTALSAVVVGFCAAVIVTFCQKADAAENLPISGVDKDQSGYTSMDDAATSGVKVAMSHIGASEFGGAVYSLNSKFFYTLPVSQKSETGVDYRIQMPAGAKLVAIYHTHTDANGMDDQLSKSDVNTAKSMNMVMYVGVVRTNTVMQYDPSRDHPHFGMRDTYSNFHGGKQINL